MKVEIQDDKTILISPENITEAYALQFITEYHGNDNLSEAVVFNGNMLFDAREKHGHKK